MSDFERAKTLFFEGLDRLERGDFAAAEQCLRESLERVPGRLSTLTNLSSALIDVTT